MQTISFSSMLGTGDEKISQYLVASYIKDRESTTTDEAAWQRILDDFDDLSQDNGGREEGAGTLPRTANSYGDSYCW